MQFSVLPDARHRITYLNLICKNRIEQGPFKKVRVASPEKIEIIGH